MGATFCFDPKHGKLTSIKEKTMQSIVLEIPKNIREDQKELFKGLAKEGF